MKIYLPLDSAAVALGADEVADAIHKHAQAKGVTVALVRNGSRGMVWLEPMVEVDSPAGRLAFGPIPWRMCLRCLGICRPIPKPWG